MFLLFCFIISSSLYENQTVNIKTSPSHWAKELVNKAPSVFNRSCAYEGSNY